LRKCAQKNRKRSGGFGMADLLLDVNLRFAK